MFLSTHTLIFLLRSWVRPHKRRTYTCILIVISMDEKTMIILGILYSSIEQSAENQYLCIAGLVCPLVQTA